MQKQNLLLVTLITVPCIIMALVMAWLLWAQPAFTPPHTDPAQTVHVSVSAPHKTPPHTPEKTTALAQFPLSANPAEDQNQQPDNDQQQEQNSAETNQSDPHFLNKTGNKTEADNAPMQSPEISTDPQTDSEKEKFVKEEIEKEYLQKEDLPKEESPKVDQNKTEVKQEIEGHTPLATAPPAQNNQTNVSSAQMHNYKKMQIAIVIDDMGLNIPNSKRATMLPAAITLSYMPYAENLASQTSMALSNGHELLLHMPMEPLGHENPGKFALTTDMPPETIKQNLLAALSAFSGYDGINNHMGSKFTADAKGMEVVISLLKERGLYFLDSRTNSHSIGAETAQKSGLRTTMRDIFLDNEISAPAILTQIKLLEHLAQRRGSAIAIGHPHTETLAVLEKWIPEAESKGFKFVSVRSLLETNPASDQPAPTSSQND